MSHRTFVTAFREFGALYGTGYDEHEADAIRYELEALGIPAGGGRLDKRPRQLERHELVTREDGEPEEEPADGAKHIPTEAFFGARWWR